ncbi:helix-turn-helix domain-containing protein [Candidatus Spongiisocius sp.]|uniref:helix-turn-helix domain-containing protein n=1 Tax=Candidatus Spongiisocius sp. TaxID=3101273 RepID=UPI003B5A7F3D
MTPHEIGAEIRARRKLLRLTQEDVADLAGVNRRLVSEVERGMVSVTLRNLIAICSAVGLDLVSQPRYPESTP